MRSSTAVLESGEAFRNGTQSWSVTRAFLFGNGPEFPLVPGETAVVPAHRGWPRIRIHLDYLTEPTELGRVTLQIIATALGSYSAKHVQRVNTVIRKAFQDRIFSFDRDIVLKDILNWLDRNDPHCWSSLKFYLSRLAAAGSKELVSEEVKQFLKTPEKFEKSDSGAYIPLMVNDPDRGALTEQEVDSIRLGLDASLNEGRLELFEYAVTWFFMTTGIRPVQMARMKIGDVRIADGGDGRQESVLRIPFGKGVQSGEMEYSLRPAPGALAGILIRYLSEIDCSNPDAPLFVSDNKAPWHVLEQVSKKINAYSTRTGDRISLTPYRFRYTLATRAIALGASDEDVAWLLTHRDTQSIKYYRASAVDLQAPIEEALGEKMNFLAAHFKGRIIDVPDDAAHGRHDANLIRDFSSLEGSVLGICESAVECGLNAPRACLGCWKFQPSADAPWDLMESVLVDEMSGHSAYGVESVVSGQLDRVREIRAVCDAKRRAEEEESK